MITNQDVGKDNPISTFLRWSVESFPSGNTRVEEIVLRHGRRFEPSSKPKGMRLGPKKKCFSNSYHVASKFDYLYVEGFALNEATGGPFHHAWISDDGVRAFDVTLRRPLVGLHYFGIAFPLSVATCEMVRSDLRLPLLDYSKPKVLMEKLIEDAGRVLASRPPEPRSSA
jgi:hypothetical protein